MTPPTFPKLYHRASRGTGCRIELTIMLQNCLVSFGIDKDIRRSEHLSQIHLPISHHIPAKIHSGILFFRVGEGGLHGQESGKAFGEKDWNEFGVEEQKEFFNFRGTGFVGPFDAVEFGERGLSDSKTTVQFLRKEI